MNHRPFFHFTKRVAKIKIKDGLVETFLSLVPTAYGSNEIYTVNNIYSPNYIDQIRANSSVETLLCFSSVCMPPVRDSIQYQYTLMHLPLNNNSNNKYASVFSFT